ALRGADFAVAKNCNAGFTTLVAFCVTKNWVCGGSSGDSAAVVVRRQAPPTVLTARQHKNPPVGSGDAIFVPFHTELSAAWVLLAMSDGVWKFSGMDHLRNIASRSHGIDIINTSL